MLRKVNSPNKVCAGPLQLEKLEHEPCSEFGWKSWKTIAFSPALDGKAGMLFLCLIIINSIIR